MLPRKTVTGDLVKTDARQNNLPIGALLLGAQVHFSVDALPYKISHIWHRLLRPEKNHFPLSRGNAIGAQCDDRAGIDSHLASAGGVECSFSFPGNPIENFRFGLDFRAGRKFAPIQVGEGGLGQKRPCTLDGGEPLSSVLFGR